MALEQRLLGWYPGEDFFPRLKRMPPLRWEPRSFAQGMALNSRAEILLFGGAAGSLKTETLLLDAVREANNPNLNAIIFRESFRQLADIQRKSGRLFRGRPFWGKCIATEYIWVFPRNLRKMREVARTNDQRYARGLPLLPMPEPIYAGGAALRFGYLRNDDDCYAHDGQEYSYIGFDESTHYTEYQIRYLLGRLRSTDPSLSCRVRLASNPGGPSHIFHTQLFIGEECSHCKPKSPNVRKPFTIYHDAKFPDGRAVNHSTEFIPGRVTDHNLFADPGNPEAGNEPYIRHLAALPSNLAKALREGCWAQIQGQFFACWNESRMVVRLADAPVEWWHHHFTGTDWGVGSSQAATILCARTRPSQGFPDGQVYALKELCRPHSNVDEYSREFLSFLVLPELDGQRRKIVASYMGPDSWADHGYGFSIAGQFTERLGPYGISLMRGSTDREGGWQRIYSMLESGELVICSDTCPQLVKAIASRLHDPKKPGDIIKRPGDPYDDVIDALRYAIYSHINGGDVMKPFSMRIADATRNLNTDWFRLWKAVIDEASKEGDQSSCYSRCAHLQFPAGRPRRFRRGW